MSILEEMASAVIKRDVGACVDLANQIINEGIDPLEAIQEGFAKGMETVGHNFESGEFYLPEMILAAKAMNAGVDVLNPVIASKSLGKVQDKGKVVLATVQGDMHDIGKNILKLIMSTSGFEVIDLGKDVKVDTIISEAKDQKADIIGLSALMTTTMGYMPTLIQELTEMGIRQDFKVMIGGAPVTEEWANEIGSDGYAKDAVEAVQVAKAILNVNT